MNFSNSAGQLNNNAAVPKNTISYYVWRFISNDVVRKITKVLRINTAGKKIYFNLFSPRDKKITHIVEGITAQFSVKNYTELMYFRETAVGIGDERPIIKKMLENIYPGDTVFDVGGFLGLLAIFFSKKTGESGKVVVFEPSPQSYKDLNSNIALNNLHNVTTINVALGDTMGTGFMKGDDMSMYSLSSLPEKDSLYHKTQIMPGDAVIEKRNLPAPNVIKIDVEGYEYAVLRGLENALRKDSCRMVCCEVHPAMLPIGVTPDTVIGLLKDFGFEKIEISGRGANFHVFCYKS